MTARFSFRLALLLAAASGFIALAYEIVWARLFNFSSGSRAPAFAAMLGSYLFGLAIGSLFSQRWQRTDAREAAVSWRALGGLIVVANIVSFLIPPVASWMILSSPWVRFMPLVMVASALLGIILPLLCHLVISADTRAGAKMSYIYLANIIGSGAGSLITGFFLTDWLKLWQLASVLLVGGVLVSAALLFFLKTARPIDGALWLAGLALACASPWLHAEIYERLQWKEEYRAGNRFERVIETRHGVITVTPTNLFVYGNGVYDGVIEPKLKPLTMMIRPYMVSAFHPNPREVLVIGMSAGAWTQILVNHPQVEKVTVVEIDHGYLQLVKEYPQVSSLLTNARVEIHIDDGRRWLRRNPDRRFDAIVMNTSFHWREFASALLSKEFLQVIKEHLKPGGFAMWNTTDSARCIRTGMEVFPHTVMIANFCAGSESPMIPDKERWVKVLREYRIDGEPVFDLATEQGRQDLDKVIPFIDAGYSPACRLIYRPELEQALAGVPIVTDDNLGEEYEITLATLLKALF